MNEDKWIDLYEAVSKQLRGKSVEEALTVFAAITAEISIESKARLFDLLSVINSSAVSCYRAATEEDDDETKH